MPSFKPDKLRVNLKLCINRLKLLEKKKGEFTMVHSQSLYSESCKSVCKLVTPLLILGHILLQTCC